MTHSSTASARRRRRLHRLSRGLCLAASLGAAVAGIALTSGEARAGVPQILQKGTKPMAFLLGLGPSWGVGGSRWYYSHGPGCKDGFCNYGGWGGRYGGAFKVTQEFMGHFKGDASGPALGVILNETFAGPYIGFSIAPKFTYDIQVKKGLALYVSPSVSLGYGLVHYRGIYYGNYAGANYHAANLQFGVALKLIIKDQWLVFAQLPNFDFLIGPGSYYYANGACAAGFNCGTYFVSRMDFILGGGITF